MDAKVTREQTIRDTKCNLILDAARKVFFDKGFHEARLEDIAASAGFSKASLYNYFTDKEQIFLNLAIRDFDDLLTKIQQGIIYTQSLKKSLEYFFRTVFTFFGDHFAFFGAVMSPEMMCNLDAAHHQNHHKELFEKFKSHSTNLVEAFAAILKTARDNNEISSPVGDLVLANHVGALIRGAIFDCKMTGTLFNVEKTVAELLEFVLHGLGYQDVKVDRL